MTLIELIETRGTTSFTLSVNKNIFTINRWKSGFDLLVQFIRECEHALLELNPQLILGLHKKYDLPSPLIFLTISEIAFEKHFIHFFSHCWKNCMKTGVRFSRKYFCGLIYQSFVKSTLLAFTTLFDKAENQFYSSVAPIELGKAFMERSIPNVHNIYKSLDSSRFFHIAINELHLQFESYLNFCADNIFQQNRNVSFSVLCKYSLSAKIPNVQRKFENEFLIQILQKREVKNLLENNQTSMKLGHSIWKIPYRDVQINRVKSFDFSGINLSIMKEIQLYLLFYYKKGESAKSLSRRFTNIRRIIIAIQEISPDCFTLIEITYVEVLQLFDVLKQAKTKHNQRRFTLKTIQGSISEARILFDWLKSNYDNETQKNPFRSLKLNNMSSFVKSTDYIPDEVIEQLSNLIHECPVYVQRIWFIMINTGMRVSEALNLEEDCLVYNEKESTYYVSFMPSKNINQRRRRGLDDYHCVPILEKEIVELISQQIEDSVKMRQIGMTKKIFLKYGRNRDQQQKVMGYLSSSIMNYINDCIKKHQIKDGQGFLWHFSNRQCRKTLAVKLLSNGSSVADVGEILGHMEEKTTRVYYQDIDSMKIAELDRHLFEQLFESLEEDIQKAFTLNELEQLKKEIMTGVRETPEGHGSCVKHISFGPCKKRSCVGCSLLITGPQKLPMWRNLYAEQQTYIESMVVQMKMQDIKDYENYRDYQAELHLLNLYQDTIIKIEKFIQERIPGYENQ